MRHRADCYYAVRALTPEELETAASCSPVCPQRPEFAVCCSYRTGSDGMVEAEKNVCFLHAQQFSEQHGCPFPIPLRRGFQV